jgi:hypothetical protein
MDRPNVLDIVTDQQSHAAMICAGQGELRMPAMGILPATGMRFT